MPTDIEIAQKAELAPIGEIARRAGIEESELELYGRYKAKVDLSIYDRVRENPDGKLIYVTAITPTPAGEGKTCTAIGVTDALGRLGKRAMLCLREPSLGPVFGIKGGAAGGGYAQVLPMEDINLHFTGDIHAVGSAHNLLSALVDNHIVKGNALGIDPTRVTWGRVMDMSDRQLRHIVTGLGGKGDGIPMESGFSITAASEIMAILCLAEDLADLKARLGRIVVGYTYDNKPVTAHDLQAEGAMAMLLKDAVKPNLVQTLEGQPAFVHGGPFANIAHGNNSIIATRLARKLADYVVTEGGFASELGMEKFLDIVGRTSGIIPDAVVLVATVRALKYHGGADAWTAPDMTALSKGMENLVRHTGNIRDVFGLPVVVALNRFPADTDEEVAYVLGQCAAMGVPAAESRVVGEGGAGGMELAELVLDAAEQEKHFACAYPLDIPIEEKIGMLARRVYGAEGVEFTAEAQRSIRRLRECGFGGLPVCVAKTQRSLSDVPQLRGAPTGWKLTVRDVTVSAGAGFLVALTGAIMTMPGLPAHPASENMDILDDGTIIGLF